MTITKTLLASGAALLLFAGVAAAAPATARTDLNLRSGPGTQFPVVGSIPAGETVDVGGCTGSWCQVNFSGGSGFANRSYLALAGGGPSVGVAVAPGPVYDDTPDYAYDDSYDYGYGYGPSVGFYAGSRFHHRRHWDGARTGTWQGRPGGWSGARTGTWQGGTGTPGTANFNRPGGGAGFARPGSVSPQVSAPVGMGGRGGGGIPGGGAAAAGPRAGSGFGGGAAVGAHGTAAQFGAGQR